ncbi:MAG TPA: type I DNA topoisomerase, partial [Myxococcales bacterium]|nr:type I DNA topoisomerase [Myxococcales bacterium]
SAAKAASDGAPPKAGKKAAPRKAAGAGYLVVVESPSKAKTIKKYLGRNYTVKASVGHVKDLPKSKLGVDPEHGFKTEFVVKEKKDKVLAEIKKAAQASSATFLATDPDREGEAIAYDIAEEMGKGVKIQRVLFNEITKKAVQEAIQHPLELDLKKNDSQRARRILDRLVGYQISPILWDKVRRGLSAGRVQSVAVRLVVEREREIGAFVPVEYWTLDAELAAKLPPAFTARLTKLDGQKAEVKDEATAKGLVAELEKASWTVAKVDRRERKRNPPAPFITSKLQQEASNRLHFTPKKTMTLAQKLYEGVELGEEGSLGLITYMRTDSTRLSAEAVAEVRALIEKQYGKESLPAEPNVFKSKKAAQDAHEAIRPTSLEWPPERVQPFVEPDVFRLYELIWRRFVACQMAPAVYDQTSIDIAAGRATFRATGTILKFAGYLAVYGQQPDEAEEKPADGEKEDSGAESTKELPPVEAGESLTLQKLLPEQHFTQPPPRFTEASLVKELEEKGIGRPSTYASILSTIEKEYVEKIENRLRPTEVGTLVTDLLVSAFPRVIDVAFTAGMEEQLDEIAEGNLTKLKMLDGFYEPFKGELARAKEQMRNVKREEIQTDLKCEKCGKPMVIKWGRRGSFLACSGYPECKNTMDYRKDEDGQIVAVPQAVLTTNEVCDKCGAPMVVKTGRFGRFLACSRYPDCKGTRPFTIGVACPECKVGQLTERRSKRGKPFYGCNRYPECKFAAWDKPVAETCPDCGSPYLLEKFTKRDGVVLACPNSGKAGTCTYRRVVGERSEAPAAPQPPPF